MKTWRINELDAASFEGVVPALLATCSIEGMPNLTWLSQVFRVDERHVALSCQFFRKTRDNLDRDPRAQLLLFEPSTLQQFRLDLRFARRETSGPVFDSIAHRVQAGASLSQMEDVFKLRSADVFEVMMVTRVELAASLSESTSAVPTVRAAPDPLSALSRIAEGISHCRGLEALVQSGLSYLTLHLGLDTASLYLAEPSEQSLYALASRGYPLSGVGARIAYGVGLVGTVAQQRMPIRIADRGREVRYGLAIREQLALVSEEQEREVPLPGLHEAKSMLAVPLVLEGELFGVLSSESTRLLAYDERDVLLLQTAGQVLAQAVARALDRAREAAQEPEPEPARAPGRDPSESGNDAAASEEAALRVHYYEVDDSVFLDDEYLIKGLPGRILWLLLSMQQNDGRESFSNRELRLHPDLKLPTYKDNLEARLLMLQRRLQDKSPSLRLHREQRGRLSLHCERRVELSQTRA
jgi:adenylate cyclase